jgi:hypothetical protein
MTNQPTRLNPFGPQCSSGLVPAGVPAAPAVFLLRHLEELRAINLERLTELSEQIARLNAEYRGRLEAELVYSMRIDHLRAERAGAS